MLVFRTGLPGDRQGISCFMGFETFSQKMAVMFAESGLLVAQC